jgi:hypothetical protein
VKYSLSWRDLSKKPDGSAADFENRRADVEIIGGR